MSKNLCLIKFIKNKKIVNREFNNLFFLFHEQKVERAPRKTQINNQYSWFHFLLIFSRDFQF